MANSIVNMPTTKILVDMYNLDVTKLKEVKRVESANGKTLTSTYNYEDPAFDVAHPVIVEVVVSRRTRSTGEKYTHALIELSGWWVILDSNDEVLRYERALQGTYTQWDGHSGCPDVLAQMRFASAGVFLLSANISASAVPSLGVLTALANGRTNVYG